MGQIRDWGAMKEMSARLLKERTGEALRLEGRNPSGRLQPSKIDETMKLQISLTKVEEVDSELLDWMQVASDENS